MTRLTSFFLLFSDSWFCFCRIENRKGGEREVRFHTCHVHSLLQLKSHMLQSPLQGLRTPMWSVQPLVLPVCPTFESRARQLKKDGPDCREIRYGDGPQRMTSNDFGEPPDLTSNKWLDFNETL